MNNLFYLLILTFSFTSSLFGQNFGAVGTEWYYSESAGGSCPGNCEYIHYKSVYDTIIDGKTTHKITQTYYKYGGDTVFLDPLYVYSQSDTTFKYSFSKSRFLSLYIFNKSQGDTITLDSPEDLFTWTDTTYRLVIDTVINVTVNGIALNKYGTTALDDYSFWNGGYFMDRIGGMDWFFPRAATTPEAGGPIRCYSDTQIDTSFQTIACDYILPTSISELTDKYNIEIYPNPTSELISITTSQAVNKIELYDLTGRLLNTTNYLTLDFSKLTVGQYILKIHLKTGEIIERKIIKNMG